MLRLLIVPECASEARALLARCRRVASRRDIDEVEIVLVMDEGGVVSPLARLARPEIRVVQVPAATPMVERLDAGLFLRPLPDQLIVVGRDPACSSAEMFFLVMLLELRPDLAAIATDHDGPDPTAGVLVHGGAFRPGALVSAGGFAGDGRRPLPVRLDSLGYDTIVLPVSAAPLEERSA